MPSDLDANSFGGTAKSTENAIDMPSDWDANSSRGALNSSQTQ
jgi:hypothetical protein